VTRQRDYLERGQPVQIITWWGPGGGPRNVAVRRPSGVIVVRPFRGLRRIPGSQQPASQPDTGGTRR
jgi:hypothetical protein